MCAQLDVSLHEWELPQTKRPAMHVSVYVDMDTASHRQLTSPSPADRRTYQSMNAKSATAIQDYRSREKRRRTKASASMTRSLSISIVSSSVVNLGKRLSAMWDADAVFG